ncbi:MAG: 5'-3' exonuclease H3TH domain-containing protein [Verrucomicrobiota bacterium]
MSVPSSRLPDIETMSLQSYDLKFHIRAFCPSETRNPVKPVRGHRRSAASGRGGRSPSSVFSVSRFLLVLLHPSMMAQTLLLDGYNLTFRSFYAVPELTRSDGFPTNALHGWVKTVWRLNDMYPDARIIAFFDLDGDRKREELLPDYKANRSEMPDELRKQIPEIRKVTELMGIRVVEQSGVEADDLIASAAKLIGESGGEAVIVSADKDMAQCIGGPVTQLLPPPTANPRLGWRTLDESGVQEKFGVRPDQIADYLALVGDTSDNIPGLSGVGPKTASNWLRSYGTIEAIIQNSGRLKPPRFQTKVSEERENLLRNQELTRLDRGHSVSLEAVSPQTSELRAFLEEMEMKATASEVEKRYGG